MLQHKVTEIKGKYDLNNLEAENILKSFKALKLSKSFSEFNIFKQRGYSFSLVLSILISMIVSTETTVHGYLSSILSSNTRLGKDVFYRLKNEDSVPWRSILWHISLLFLKICSENSTEQNKTRYLIFDDSVLEKTGKRIEFIGRVWDHVSNKFVLGVKLLAMIYWDGVSSIPLDFSLHREKGKREEKPYGMSRKELKRQYSRKHIKNSHSIKRIEELDESKIEMLLKMFHDAIYRGLKVDYVLVDSWFTCSALIQAVKEQSIHLIGMYKFPKTKFEFEGEHLTCYQIKEKLGKAKRCRTLGYNYKRANVVYQGYEITLYFSRQGSKGKWKIFLTTDRSLSFIELIKHYQVRWTIEVFFKEGKQLLKLGKCQSNNFNAQIADTTTSMIAYILISFRMRYEYYESKGALFKSMKADNIRETLEQRLWGEFVELLQQVAITFDFELGVFLSKTKILSHTKSVLSKMIEDSPKNTV